MNKKFLLPFFVLAAILTLSSCSNKLKPLAEQLGALLTLTKVRK